MTYNIIRKQAWQWMVIVTLLSVFSLPTQAAIPDNVDYQGYLTDSGGSPINGTVSVTFSLYNIDTGGIALWSDTQAVTLTNGLFNVKLGGAGAPFPLGLFDDPLWLGIEVAGDGEMTPRITISSAAFAHKADDAYTLEGISASSLDQSAHVTDTGNPHIVTAAQTGAISSAEFTLHTGDASAHHAKFTDAEAVAAMGVLDNTNSLNHDRRSGGQVFNAVLSRDGAGSTLDADLFDGLDSTAFMSSGTDNWVNTTGDTMTGDLYVLANVGIGTAIPSNALLNVRGGVSSYLGYFRNDNNTVGGYASGLYAAGDAQGTGTGDGRGGYFIGYGGSTSGAAYGTQHAAYAYGSSPAFGVYSYATGGSTTGREWAFFGMGDGYFSGNVGIGTTTPAYGLDVQGGVSDVVAYFNNDNNTSGGYAEGIFVAGDARDTGTGRSYGASFFAYGGDTSGSAYSTRHFAFANGSSTAYGVYSLATLGTTTGREFAFYGIGDGYFSGNVGIGTQFPVYDLEVRGGVDGYVGFFYNDNDTTGNAYGIYGLGDARGTGTGLGIGGYFVGYGGSTSGNTYGSSHLAFAYGSSTAYGVYSDADGGTTTGSEYAFYGWGDAYISGTLSKGGGAFKIDHPLDPENKYLYHSFVESPDMMNVYNGNVILDDNGEARVTMPDWFNALNKDFRYQLTPIGAPGPNLYIAQEITGNTFAIAGGQPGMKVSWMVTGIRQDAFANTNRIPVEEDKKGIEVGTYLHPEAHGKTRDRSLAKAQAIEMGHPHKE